MPRLSDKQQAFVNSYCTNGYNATKAYRLAYPDNKTPEFSASRLLSNVKIKAAINAFKAETAKALKITRESQIKRLDTLYAMAIKQGNVTAAKGCIVEQNEMLGLRQEKAENREDVARKLERLTAEQILRERHFEDARERELAAEVKPLRIVG